MKKEKKRRILQILISTVTLILVVVGISYAYIIFSTQGTETNLIKAGCLKVSLSGKNNISLSNAIAVTDSYGMSSTPYTYTLTNSCSLDAYYETAFSVTDVSSEADLGYVKLFLEGNSYVAPKFLNTFNRTTITNSTSTYNYLIDSGFLKKGESKSFDLRMWIDYDTTANNWNFSGKVIITSYAESGYAFDTGSTGYQIYNNNIINNNANFSLISPNSVGDQIKGLFKENNEEFYFRGDTINNYVKFGKYSSDVTVSYKNSSGIVTNVDHSSGDDMLWRIVKINKDGSVKIVLDDYIGESSYYSSKTSVDALSYENSNVKSILEEWYNNNFNNNSYLIKENYCNDTSSITNNSNIYYGSYTRNVTSNSPSTSCSSPILYNVGLLTADEIAMAGGLYNTANNSYYLYKNVSGEWSMSPASFINSSASSFISSALKSLDVASVDTAYAIRPVVNLKSNLTLKGNGTIDTPYEVTGIVNDK